MVEEHIPPRLPSERFRRVERAPEPVGAVSARGVLRRLGGGLRRNPLAMVCLVVLLAVITAALLAPLSPYDPDVMDFSSKLAPPSAAHFFGTDELGRDYFTRALYGGRVSLTVGVCAMLVSVVIGTVVGTVSGYVGGRVDTLIMRLIDVLLSVPSFLLIIILNSFIRPSMSTMIVIIALFAWMGVARIVRAETMRIKQHDFVLAAQNLGTGGWVIMLRHIIPNMSSPIIVAASLSIAKSILTESSLSFLGFGVQQPISSWGSMLQSAQTQILDMPLLAFFPGVFILLTVLSFNVLGDVLRGALEPKLER